MSTVGRFSEDLKAALQDTTAYVRSRSAEVPIRHRQQWKIIRTNEERTLDRREVVSSDYSFFVGTRRNDIQEMSSFKQLFASIQADAEIARALRLESNSTDEFLNRYFISIVTSVLEREDAGNDRGQAEAAVLAELDDFLTKDTYTARVCATLLNFNSDVADVELVDGIFLRRVSDVELESHINAMNLMVSYVGLYRLLEINFQLEAVMEQERTNTQPLAMGAKVQHKSEDLLIAFRLIKPGAIGYSFTAGQATAPLGFGGIWMALPGPENIFGPPYDFVQTDIDQLRNVLKNLKTLEKDTRFSLALRRLMDAYRKPLGGDRLVDYWIGLESLLLPAEKEGELRFRAALRGAWFIGGDPAKRTKTFNDLRWSYDERSAVVHGTEKNVDQALVLQTEEHLRSVLWRCLELGQTPSSKMLNSLVVTGLPE
jgi:hypothetical protein